MLLQPRWPRCQSPDFPGHAGRTTPQDRRRHSRCREPGRNEATSPTRSPLPRRQELHARPREARKPVSTSGTPTYRGDCRAGTEARQSVGESVANRAGDGRGPPARRDDPWGWPMNVAWWESGRPRLENVAHHRRVSRANDFRGGTRHVVLSESGGSGVRRTDISARVSASV